jgi:hypothetical protein
MPPLSPASAEQATSGFQELVDAAADWRAASLPPPAQAA